MPDNELPQGKLAYRITTRHEASKHGRPVVLDEYAQLVGDAEGVRRFMFYRSINAEEFARILGNQWTVRSINHWLAGTRRVPIEVLNILRGTLQDDFKAIVSQRMPRLPRIEPRVMRKSVAQMLAEMRGYYK
jgi:hypothetical protein